MPRSHGRLDSSSPQTPLHTATAIGDPVLVRAVQDAFLSGLTTGCAVLAALCFAAAVIGLAALPGRRFHAAAADAERELVTT